MADLAAFRLRCPPNSAFSRLGDGVVLGARYASLLAARKAGAEARTATIIAKRAVFLDTPLREAVEAVVNDTNTRRPAPVRVTLHAAIRDRTGGALVYHVESDRATDLTLHMTVPGALEPLLWDSTVLVDGVSAPLVDFDFRDDVTAFRISATPISRRGPSSARRAPRATRSTSGRLITGRRRLPACGTRTLRATARGRSRTLRRPDAGDGPSMPLNAATPETLK